MKAIGKYEILEELRTNAVGSTYRVRDNFRNREFILKILNPIASLSPAAKQEFCRDLIAATELQHRHLVKVYDLGEVEAGTYIASELLPGTNLHQFLLQNPDASIGQKLGILAQVCEGLAFAHGRNITHGDLKPTNIFVDSNRDVTIVDFGMGKWREAANAAGVRADGFPPNYLAPEQILGQRADARADVFSIGLIAYEFLAGRYPYSVPEGLLPREIVHTDPEPIRKLAPEIPEELESLLAELLLKDPQQRVQTAEKIAAWFYKIARGLRHTPSPPPIPSEPEPSVELMLPEPVATTPSTLPPPAFAPYLATLAIKQPEIEAQTEDTPPQPAVISASTGSAQPGTESPMQGPPVPATESAPAVGAMIAQLQTQAASMPPAGAAPQPGGSPVKSRKRIALTVTAGALLAIYSVTNFISRQNLTASQDAAPAKPAAGKNSVESAPLVPQPAADPTPAIPPIPAGAVTAGFTRPPTPSDQEGRSADQILRGQVKKLWEAGDYAQAMVLVDDVLVENPASGEARSWKKRIRAAQEAEAAIR